MGYIHVTNSFWVGGSSFGSLCLFFVGICCSMVSLWVTKIPTSLISSSSRAPALWSIRVMRGPNGDFKTLVFCFDLLMVERDGFWFRFGMKCFRQIHFLGLPCLLKESGKWNGDVLSLGWVETKWSAQQSDGSIWTLCLIILCFDRILIFW